jgi:hypothetical protein
MDSQWIICRKISVSRNPALERYAEEEISASALIKKAWK